MRQSSYQKKTVSEGLKIGNVRVHSPFLSPAPIRVHSCPFAVALPPSASFCLRYLCYLLFLRLRAAGMWLETLPQIRETAELRFEIVNAWQWASVWDDFIYQNRAF
jgi:hypothetical protein